MSGHRAGTIAYGSRVISAVRLRGANDDEKTYGPVAGSSKSAGVEDEEGSGMRAAALRMISKSQEGRDVVFRERPRRSTPPALAR